jgi:FlaA1/EpsC-like NDP-sugar epimerase
MGATKRVAECIVRAMDRMSPSTSFCAVRFGNVLGSNGSVVPIFQGQIKAGGPVTITHPQMRRFFMTISEAVQLVIQSACVSEGGEVFVLDMGEQVRIMDLAYRLIRLHGYEPGRDIPIEVTGLRPGEKLYEELFDTSETVERTPFPKLMRARGGTLWAMEDLDRWISEFEALPGEQGAAQAAELLSRLVPSCQFSGKGHDPNLDTRMAEAQL